MEVLVFLLKNGVRMKIVKMCKLRKEVVKIMYLGVDGGKFVVWKESSFVILLVLFFFLEGCNIIDICYFLKVILIVLWEFG